MTLATSLITLLLSFKTLLLSSNPSKQVCCIWTFLKIKHPNFCSATTGLLWGPKQCLFLPCIYLVKILQNSSQNNSGLETIPDPKMIPNWPWNEPDSEVSFQNDTWGILEWKWHSNIPLILKIVKIWRKHRLDEIKMDDCKRNRSTILRDWSTIHLL